MAEALSTPASIFWMLGELLEHRRFRYEAWAEEFRDGGPLANRRDDRKFFQHLQFLKEVAVPLLSRGHSSWKVVAEEEGAYVLVGDRGNTPEFHDSHWADFYPLLHGLNRRSTLVPFPTWELEKQLEEAFDPPEEPKGRVLYKNEFHWRLKPDHLITFLEAVQEGRRLVVSQGGRGATEVVPLFVVNFDGNWHLLGRQGSRWEQFNLSRISELTKGERADLPTDRELSEARAAVLEVYGIHLLPRHDAGWSGEVTVRYRGSAFRYAQERFTAPHRPGVDPWSRVVQNTESLDVTLRVNSYEQILSEVLGWGADAEPLAPQAFRELWRCRVRDLARMALGVSPS